MARRRVCLVSIVSLLILAPATALAQQPGVAISGAPSFANRHSSYAVSITSTAPASSTATFSLGANFPDVTFSQSSWSLTCGVSSCASTQTVTVFTGATGGRTLQITATGAIGSSRATSTANTWIRGASTFSPATVTLQPLQTQTITVTLQTAAPVGVTFQLLLSGPGAAGSSVPATVTVGTATTTAAFVLTAGPNAGAVTLTGTTGSLYYTAPLPAQIEIENPTQVPTPAGTNVTVTPPIPDGGAVPVSVTFAQVTGAGQTEMVNVAAPAAPPSGYEIPGTPLYFGLLTSATTSGSATVCATYPNGAASDETGLRLFVLTPDGWVDTTQSVDAAGNVICGSLASVNGMTFAIFRLNSAPEVGAIIGPTGIVIAGETQQFSATFTDADTTDTHTGVWIWGDGTTSPAVIGNVNGTLTASGEHAFGAGTHQVSLVITDGGQPDASAAFAVTADGSAPVIHSLIATPGSLSPPYNRMVGVTLIVSATDDTGRPVCAISGVSATSGNPKQAAFAITGPLTLQLKAFPNTAYSIDAICTDAVGRQASRSVSVQVQK